ncbi:MAG: AAA family ATPase, partial [Bacteroidales bacterium]|nr:AAA family ATPase [Bacteroidales bacterium]
MKFKHLHIHNLASLEEAGIDFGHTPLDNPIFLICGETGSGKSTLLDAICLALYDSSPRFKASSTDKFKVAGVFGEVANNNPMQILRENADKGFAELVFEGNDGREYTARWSVRRIRKRGMDEHENARDWTLSFVEDNTEITLKKIDEVKNRIEEAVGLNFEQFCRTSMLAQGEFTKFLKSNDTEKSAILEKLTDTGHFARMGTRIYEKAAGKKRLWEQAGRDMENMQLLSEEQIAEKEAEKAALTERLSRLAEETQTLRKRHEWRKKQEELKRRKAEADEAVKRAQEGVNGEDYCNGKRMLQEWEMSEEARMWLEQSKEAEREAMAAQEGLQAQEREFSVLLG